jgi:chromate transporter
MSDEPSRPASLLALFLVFSGLALRGFGGVLPWAQRALVDERGWLSREQFVEILAFGQLLPGPNICNLSIIVGDRFFGWRGALVALTGMMAAPAVLVLLVAVGYGQVAGHPVARGAITGMSAVSAGLILANAIRLAGTLRQRWRWLGFALAAFGAVGLMHWSLPPVLGGLLASAVGLAWWGARR